jgi:hypothetical protein
MVLKPTLAQEWIDDGCIVDEAMSLTEMDLLEYFGVEE